MAQSYSRKSGMNFADKNLNLLSLRDQKKVIHEYNLKKPQPTVLSLANKYNVGPRHIQDILRNQKTILKANNQRNNNEVETLGTQRQEQINFLDMVMYEYLNRTLYHNMPVDDEKFLRKADQVRDCMAILKFKPTYAWVVNFKKKYGLEDFSMETLRREVSFKEVKPKALDPVGMVRYVQQRKDELIKAQKDTQTSSGLEFFEDNDDESSSKKDKPTVQLRKKNDTPKIVYEIVDDDLVPKAGQTDANDGATIKIEIAPTQLSEYNGPQPTAVEKTKENHEAESDESESEDNEFLTIYEIIDDEATKSQAAESRKRFRTPLSNIKTYSRKPKISRNTADDITIKTEPQSDDAPMETKDNTISTHSLPEDVIIKTENSTSLELDDIKPPIVFETSEEFLTINKNETNDYQLSSRLDKNKQPCPNPKPPEVLDEDIKPTTIFEESEEMLMENNAGTNYHHNLALAPGKRPHVSSPLPDIDTLEEAMRHLKVIENYVMLKENFRAIGLVTQLEEAIKKPPEL